MFRICFVTLKMGVLFRKSLQLSTTSIFIKGSDQALM
jgi:hypothetical protein